jgi:hypothetical protein
MLADYFGPGLRWMAQDGGQAQLGVTADVVEGEQGAGVEPLLLHIGLAEVQQGQEMRVLSAPTVIILPGEVANFRMSAGGDEGGERIRYRCAASAAYDGSIMICVEADLERDPEGQPRKLGGCFHSLSDVALPVAFRREGAGGYALFASARWLDRRARDRDQT